jgi:hypothetical protein
MSSSDIDKFASSLPLYVDNDDAPRHHVIPLRNNKTQLSRLYNHRTPCILESPPLVHPPPTIPIPTPLLLLSDSHVSAESKLQLQPSHSTTLINEGRPIDHISPHYGIDQLDKVSTLPVTMSLQDFITSLIA